MLILPIKSASLRKVFNSTANSFNPVVLGRAANDKHKDSDTDNRQSIKRRSVTEKVLSYKPIAQYKQHTLHYVLKTIGYTCA